MHLSPWILSERLSKKFDDELDINFNLSISLVFYLFFLSLSNSFSIGTEKLPYFSVFSPKHSNCSSSCSAYSYVEPLWNITGIYFSGCYPKNTFISYKLQIMTVIYDFVIFIIIIISIKSFFAYIANFWYDLCLWYDLFSLIFKGIISFFHNLLFLLHFS